MDTLNWFISHFFDWSPSVGDIFMIFLDIVGPVGSHFWVPEREYCERYVQLPEVIKDIKKTSSLIDVDIRNISLRSGLHGSSKYWQYSFVLNIQNICSYIWLAMICPILLIFLVCKGIKILEISVLRFGLQIFKIFVCRYSKY